MTILYFILAAAGGYLLGSIPFGLVLTRAVGIDLRSIGSGNIGATNVLRSGRRDIALATLLFDAGKAAAALLVARALVGESPYWTEIGLVAGGAAFLGHCFPVWLKFKGGKGVATYFGVLFAGAWPLGLVSGVVWLAVATMFRLSSLAALCAGALAPIFALIAGFSWCEIIFTLILGALVFWRHQENIQRLRAGTEPKIGAGKAEAAPTPSAEPPAPAPAAEPPAPADT